MTLEIEHAGLTDRGLVREENEDNWSVVKLLEQIADTEVTW